MLHVLVMSSIASAESLEGVEYDIVLVLVFEDSDSYVGKEVSGSFHNIMCVPL